MNARDQFSECLSNELIVAKMSRALRDVIDMTITASRLHHYKLAGVTEEDVLDFDRKAVHVESARRRTLPQQTHSFAGIAARLAGTVVVGVIGYAAICVASLANCGGWA